MTASTSSSATGHRHDATAPPAAAGAYRDDRAALLRRREVLVRRHRQELEQVGDALETLYSRRVARVAGGVVALAGAGVLYAAVLVSLLTPEACSQGSAVLGSAFAWATGCPIGVYSWVLLGTPLLAVFGYLCARAVAALYMRSLLLESLMPGEDLHADVGRLERERPTSLVREAAQPLELASVALPLLAASLLAPLWIHYLAAAISRQGVAGRDFDQWIRLSLALVGHCHLVLAWLSWRFARRLVAGDVQQPAAEAWRAWGITLASSAVPGVVLLAVPVLVVALTGAMFIPALFGTAARTWQRERLLLVGPVDGNVAVDGDGDGA